MNEADFRADLVRAEEAMPLVPQNVAATQELLVITGMSGAGRTNTAHVLEDSGWYVVDNLPVKLISSLVATMATDHPSYSRLAIVLDMRVGDFGQELTQALSDLSDRGLPHRLLFLDASDEALVRRFESVRRPHPLQGEGTVLEGIHKERLALGPLRAAADHVLDTSVLNVHQLAKQIRADFSDFGGPSMHVTVMSFGFKYGIPLDADHVADVRFIPNPYWIPELRPLTGQDAKVSGYVLEQAGAEDFLEHYLALMEPVLAGYERENKNYATIAIGCTGGKHRSVAMSTQFVERLKRDGLAVNLMHRDLGRE